MKIDPTQNDIAKKVNTYRYADKKVVEMGNIFSNVENEIYELASVIDEWDRSERIFYLRLLEVIQVYYSVYENKLLNFELIHNPDNTYIASKK